MCEVQRKGFGKLLSDNDERYLGNLLAIIESVDEYASLQITKDVTKIHFRLAPSVPKYTQLLLHEILKFNTLYGITLDLSKSIRTSSTITFNINIENQ